LGVAKSGYETGSESFVALSQIWQNHSSIQQRQNLFTLVQFTVDGFQKSRTNFEVERKK